MNADDDGEDQVKCRPIKRIKLEENVNVRRKDDEGHCSKKRTISNEPTPGSGDGERGAASQNQEENGKERTNPGKGEIFVGPEEENEQVFNGIQAVMARVPPEVWETIFSYLTTTKEIQTVMNTCHRWHSVMASKRTRLFFPLVLPHLLPYLPPSSVLSLRQVCKQWKQLIDTPLENYGTSPEKFECHWWHNDTPFEHVFKHIERPYLLNSCTEVLNFTEKISTHDPLQNPFISRALTIKFDGDSQEFRQSHATAVTFLQKFGHHIWEFTHFCPVLRGNEHLAVTLLASLLQHLPNLKSLKIDWNTDGVMIVPPDTIRFLMGANDNFPPLPNLTSLNFDFRGGGELEYMLGILALLHRYGSQLDTFVCRGEFMDRDVFSPEMIQIALPNLKNLRIFCVTSKCLEKLSKLENYPLQRLQLWYSFQYLQFRNVVKAINAFSSTLLHLHIHVKLNYPLEGWGGIIVPVEDSLENINVDPDVIKLTFPKLVRFGAPVSSLNSPFFWELVKHKFKNLERLELQTAMEALFAPFEKAYLEKEIQQSKQFFKDLNCLKVIRFWFHNKGRYTIQR